MKSYNLKDRLSWVDIIAVDYPELSSVDRTGTHLISDHLST
jgi:hypothetical protein